MFDNPGLMFYPTLAFKDNSRSMKSSFKVNKKSKPENLSQKQVNHGNITLKKIKINTDYLKS